MLVLSRKLGERIVIDGNIEVVVLEARGDRVRLGINAPHEVPVHREEVDRRIRAEADRRPIARYNGMRQRAKAS